MIANPVRFQLISTFKVSGHNSDFRESSWFLPELRLKNLINAVARFSILILNLRNLRIFPEITSLLGNFGAPVLPQLNENPFFL